MSCDNWEEELLKTVGINVNSYKVMTKEKYQETVDMLVAAKDSENITYF